MTVTISFGIQKGGVGKTTTTAITSYLLSKKHKVLAIDFDSQGNLTYFLSQKNIYDFTGKTILQALKEKDPRPYIYKVNEKLHLLTAEDFLSTLPRYLHRDFRGNPTMLLKETIDVIKENYDYILIDLPPNLGDHTVNGIAASDFAVVLLQSEPFCFDALERYLEFLQGAKDNVNNKLQLAGILTTMLDSRATLDNSILNKAKLEYEDMVFKSVIKRRSKIKEFTITGINEATKQDRESLKPYEEFTKELIMRVKER